MLSCVVFLIIRGPGIPPKMAVSAHGVNTMLNALRKVSKAPTFPNIHTTLKWGFQIRRKLALLETRLCFSNTHVVLAT